MTTRRRFLSHAAWSSAALAALPLAACAQDMPPPVRTPATPGTPVAAPGKGLLQRTIPASGQAIPAIGVGTSGSYEVPIGSPEFDALKDVLKGDYGWTKGEGPASLYLRTIPEASA